MTERNIPRSERRKEQLAQRRLQKNYNSSQGLMSRRRFVQGLAGTAILTGLTLGGKEVLDYKNEHHKFAQNPSEISLPQFEKNYSGRIDGFEGAQNMDNDQFRAVTEALYNSPSPLLQKIAYDMTYLHSTDTRPSEFPDWVDASSFPLPVCVNSSNVSIFSTHITSEQDPSKRISISGDETFNGVDLFKSIDIGILLSDNDKVKSNAPLSEGLYLAKEYMSALFSVSMSQEYWDANESYLHAYQVTRDNGEPINDPQQLQYIGENLYYHNLSVDPNNFKSATNNKIWQINDALPLLYVGSAMKNIPDSKFAHPEIGLGYLRFARNMVNADRNLGQEIENTIDRWVKSKTLLPPKGLLMQGLTDPVNRAIVALEHDMYANS